MIECTSEELEALLKQAEKDLLVSPLPPPGAPAVHDREWISERLPHRDPLLLLDRIEHIDLERSSIVGSYELSRAADVLAGHFPGHPAYPGLLQVEAIGQAGILLGLEQMGTRVDGVKLTHVLGARFLRPVGSVGILQVVARTFEDGFFMTVVGQTLFNGEICAAAAVRGLT